MTKPKLLDLFCGAGGTSVGYHRAGFDVVGVDLKRHDDFPFAMFVADALDFIDDGWLEAGNFDAVAASPPCPRYSVATPDANRDNHPDLVAPIRDRLVEFDIPFVIENVPGAPLLDPVTLCGSMFGLGVRRHRLFESNVPLTQPKCRHKEQGPIFGVYGAHADRPGGWKRPNGKSRGLKATSVEHAGEVMGIDWMTQWADLADSIPPAYTAHIGTQLLAHIDQEKAA